MDWIKDTVLIFLNLIRERPVIWDIQNRHYRDKNKKLSAMEEIAVLMGCSVEKVNTKWISMKNQYSREKRNMSGTRTGNKAKANYTSKWYAFKEMKSLIDGNKSTKQTTYNFSERSSSPTTARSLSTPPPTPITQLTSTPPSTKGKIIYRNSINKEAMDTLKPDRATRRNELMTNESSTNTDDLTTFGLYVAAQLRKFNPHLQCKAKNEINKILYTTEIQSLEDINSDSSVVIE